MHSVDFGHLPIAYIMSVTNGIPLFRIASRVTRLVGYAFQDYIKS